MSARRVLSVLGGALGLALLASAACNQLESGTKPCSKADDCPPPLVCCSNPYYISLNDLSGPSCSVRWECPDAYQAFLPQGTPCGRGGDHVNGDDCRSGLFCCPASLTCESDEGCRAKAPLTSVGEPPTTTCLADGDCAAFPGTVCCGISYSDRDGTCRPIAACGGVSAPPDGGVTTGPDAGTTDYAAQICDEAYCDESGPRAPTAAEKTICTAFLTHNPGFQATAECLAAVSDSRPICRYVLRHRNGVDSANTAPVLPAACTTNAPAPNQTAANACRKLGGCGLLGGVDENACGRHVAALGYDALSRLAVSGCELDVAGLGWAPKGPASRCQVDGDCPDSYTCFAGKAPNGLCTRSCTSDNDCLNGADAQCVANFCTARCDPIARDAATAEANCGARVDLAGTFELACVQTGNVTTTNTGVCGPFTDARTCRGNGVERPSVSGRIFPAGTECSNAPQGAAHHFERCAPTSNGTPDSCAEGSCVDGYSVCAEPCLVTGGSTICPNGQLCISSTEGLGTIGGCFEACTSGTCANGMRCISTSYSGSFCMP